MGRQNGILPFVGKIGDTVGYRKGDTHYIRKASASYQPTAESLKSATEFGKGSSAAALVRKAFNPMFFSPFKERLHIRLSEVFRQIIRTGPEALKGKRTIYNGNIALLKGFECSTYANLKDLCRALPQLNLEEKQLSLEFLPMQPAKEIRFPKSNSQAVFQAAFTAFDFEEASFEYQVSAPLPIHTSEDFNGAQLEFPIPNKKEQVLIVMLTLHFEDPIIIENRKFLAACILDAFHLRDGVLVNFENEEVPITTEKTPEPTLLNWKKPSV